MQGKDGFSRWVVRATLELITPLSIRTGGEEDGSIRHFRPGEPNPLSDDKTGADRVAIQAIELDHRGLAFLPATAFKGLLRNVGVHCLDQQQKDRLFRLFGDKPDSDVKGAAQQGRGALVTLRNAWMVEESAGKCRPAIRGRTAIHRGTRTARDGFLRYDRAVAPGARFDAEFILTDGNREDVDLLLGLLAHVDGESPLCALGSGSAQGDGRLRLLVDTVKVTCLGPAEIAEWVDAAPEKSWRDFARTVEVPIAKVGKLSIDRRTLDMEITIAGHFLVSFPQEKNGKRDENAAGDRETKPLLPFRLSGDDSKVAHLPGSSLDGALASQAERIWRTVAGDLSDWSEQGIPPAYEDLFGSVAHASLLEVGHFKSDPMDPVTQEFVAIDRFTGGSREGAKYSVRAFEAPVLKGRLALTVRREGNLVLSGKRLPESSASIGLSPEAIGLLALVLKDLATGDIPLGYGTRKGYGQVADLRGNDGGLPEILKWLGAAAKTCLEARDEENACDTSEDDALRRAVGRLLAAAEAWKARSGSGAEPANVAEVAS